MLDLTPYQEPLAAFARRWAIQKLALFGSALRNDFGPASDVDILVTFEEGETWSLLDLVEMKLELEDLFCRPVDLVEAKALRNPIRRRVIQRTQRTVYASP